VFVQHGPEVAIAVRRLQDRGVSDSEISRRTGVARGTLRRWRTRQSLPPTSRRDFRGWRPSDARAYSYLLGLYLGDGCLVQQSRDSHRLELALDGLYPKILEAAATAIRDTMPGISVRRKRVRDSRCAMIFASHPAWPYAFPQHGPGRKHERPIWLADWQ
jgi:hypothetical protein